MVEEITKPVRIDLNQFKLQLYLKPEVELTLHFDTPSRRFYLSVIALVITEMKKRGRFTSVSLEDHLDILALLNQTIGGGAGSSKREHMLPRIYRKWKDALPDLENAPLFKVVGKKKSYDDSMDRVYGFSEGEKDSWANLFEYKGSHEHVRLRFSLDRLGATLDDVTIVYGEYPQLESEDAWERFSADLKEKSKDIQKREHAGRKLTAFGSPLRRTKRLLSAGPRRWQVATVSVLIGLFVGAAIFLIWKDSLFTPQVEVASVAKMAFPLPNKPSIAVLPFENLSDDPEQDKIVDGITENIITLLSKVPELFVISRKSTFVYKGKPVKVQQVAEELGVQYVLEGSVQRSGDQVRITAQFVDALEGHHLWAERYDRQFKDVFTIQDEVALNVISALRVLLSEGEQARVVRGGTKSVEAWELRLQGGVEYNRWSKEGQAKARELFQQALTIDPDYAHAWRGVGFTHLVEARFGWSDSREDSLRAAEEAAAQALSLDDTDSGVYRLLGNIHLWKGEHDKAIAMGEKALTLNSNDSNGAAVLAMIMFWSGRPEEALELTRQAMRLNPNYPLWYLLPMAEAYRLTGRYDEAIETTEEELRRLDNFWGRTRLALYYAQTGRDEEASAEIVRLLRAKPDMTLKIWANAQFFKDRSRLERDLADLRRVGLPE